MKKKVLLIPLALLLAISLAVTGCAPVPAEVAELEADLAEREKEIAELEKKMAGMVPAPEPIEPIEWNLAVHGSSRALTEGLEWWVEEMEARTDGRFKVVIHWGEALSPMKEVIDGIKAGLFEMGVTYESLHPGKTPLSTSFALPFMAPPSTMEMYKWGIESYTHPALVKEWEAWNAKIVFPLSMCQYEVMSTKPIRTTEDLQGLRVRIVGGMAEVFEALGSVPTYFTPPETYGAFDKGMIDAIGFPWTYGFGAYKLYEVTDYAITGLSLGSFFCPTIANIDAWDALPEDIKRVHLELMLEFPEIQVRGYAEADVKWTPIFKEHQEFIQFPAEERAKIVAVAANVWDEWVKAREAEGLPGREVLDFIIKSREWVKFRY